MQELKQNNTKIWVADGASSYFQVDWFNPSNNSVITSTEQWQSGRQSVTNFKSHDYYMVLRHYCRGGLPAKFSRDKYLFCGWAATRGYREINLLERMMSLALPVPQPIAAKCELNGLFYTSDILMHEIKNSQTLAQKLVKNNFALQNWRRIGIFIKKFHIAGIQHIDLNANNILIDEQEKLYLVDFDRCVQRSYSQTWGKKGLQRLRRSLLKIQKENEILIFTDENYRALCQGYDE